MDKAAIQNITGYDARKHMKWSLRGIYNAAISEKERRGPPVVGVNKDRRAHEAFARRHNEDQVKAVMCFCCARVLLYDEFDVNRVKNLETVQEPEIQWRQCLQNGKFFGMTKVDTDRVLGFDTYMTEYGKREGGPDLNKERPQRELEDWKLTVPCQDGTTKILCCPEDRRCRECNLGQKRGEYWYCDGSGLQTPLCTKCELPVCRSCHQDLSAKTARRPPMALANDLWIGYYSHLLSGLRSLTPHTHSQVTFRP